MRKRLNADTINVNGKTVNVGIDVHKVSWHVTVLVEGIVVESATIKPSYRVLKKLFAQYKGGRIRIAYEAGFSGFICWTTLLRREGGFRGSSSSFPVGGGSRGGAENGVAGNWHSTLKTIS